MPFVLIQLSLLDFLLHLGSYPSLRPFLGLLLLPLQATLRTQVIRLGLDGSKPGASRRI